MGNQYLIENDQVLHASSRDIVLKAQVQPIEEDLQTEYEYLQ
jgi:hypothetical protein